MAQNTGVDELSGLFKIVYGPNGPIDLIPEVGMFYKELKLRETERIGSKYVMNVIVANSHGFTYNLSSNTAFALNNSIAMTTQEADISAAELVLRDAIAYRAASRSAGGNKVAFKDATELVVKNMYDSHVKRREIAMLYGGSGIGQTSASVNIGATSTTVTISTATWASGIWSGLENAAVNFYTAVPALVSSGADSIFTVTKVDDSNMKLVITGTSTGISALDTAIAAGTCDVYFNGANAQEETGIFTILANTGVLFNIDAATYGLWKANQYSCGSAQMTTAKVLKGLAKAYARGLMGKVRLVVSPLTWANLAADLAALRRYDGSYKRGKLENGTEAITFYAQNGEVEIIGYTLIKQGHAAAIPMDRVHRIGSSDISFDTPGMGGKIFKQLENNAGFELRNYSDSAIYIDSPARCVLFTNIVNVA